MYPSVLKGAGGENVMKRCMTMMMTLALIDRIRKGVR